MTPRPGLTALRVENVSKSYGATRALDRVSLDVARGEVHALLGHNGSGKSTLVKAIGGAVRPDRGEIAVGGVSGATPRLGVVHQELALCAEATVLENCCVRGYRRRWGLIDWKRERAVVERVLAQLDADFDSTATVGALSPADQAITAIARALKPVLDNSGLDLLVLDEATAALRGPDADKVLAAARKVSEAGGGVLLVTHHMSEVLSSADRATVLVSGAVAATVEVATATQDSLLELISGRSLAGLRQPSPRPEVTPCGRPRLIVSGLRADSVHDVDLTVGEGEIVGLTGAAGSGHEQVPYLLSGFQRRSGGQISVDGEVRTVHSVRASRRAGIGILPADRLARGVLPVATIRENLSPTTRARHRAKGLLRPLAERRWARAICKQYEVSTCDTEALMSSLSGGNQQKLLLARVLESHPKVVVLHEPTQGVDEATRRALVRKIRTLATSGAGVLYVSSDAEEVAGCADRVVVMRRGRSVAVIPGGLSQMDEIFAACYGTTSGPRDTRKPCTEGTIQ